MIRDLLTLAGKGQPANEFDEVDLDSIVEEAWQSVETGAAGLDIREPPRYVQTRPDFVNC